MASAVMGTNSVFKWKTIDLSGDGMETSLDFTIKALPDGRFGTVSETFVEATNQAKIAHKFYFQKTASKADVTFFGSIAAGAGAWEYYPESSGAGNSNIKYNGNGILIKHSLKSKWDALVDGSADVQVTGAVTRSVVA